jgi:hypothetical protein
LPENRSRVPSKQQAYTPATTCLLRIQGVGGTQHRAESSVWTCGWREKQGKNQQRNSLTWLRSGGDLVDVGGAAPQAVPHGKQILTPSDLDLQLSLRRAPRTNGGNPLRAGRLSEAEARGTEHQVTNKMASLSAGLPSCRAEQEQDARNRLPSRGRKEERERWMDGWRREKDRSWWRCYFALSPRRPVLQRLQRPEGEESEEVAGAGRFSSGTSLSLLYHHQQQHHRHIIAFIIMIERTKKKRTHTHTHYRRS